MFSAIKNFINEKVFGKLTHTYESIDVEHGNISCQDTFEIRVKKERFRLFHERVWSDKHDVKKFFQDYSREDVSNLETVFREAQQFVERQESEDFGIVLTRRDGSMHSTERFYVEQSGGEFFLFSQEEAKASATVIGELGSSESSTVTYYPNDEVRAIAVVLKDAKQRMSES